MATRNSSQLEDPPELLTARELKADPMFAGIPAKFLLWQQGLAVRRRVKQGAVLCRCGDPGNTAFLIKKGRLLVTTPDGRVRVELGPEHLIVGEMACLSDKPRTADVCVLQDAEVWEIRRNVLDRMMRAPSQRERVERVFRENSLNLVLLHSQLFQELPAGEFARCADFLRPHLSFVRVSPGQTIFRQGDWADHLYFVRLGHIRITIERPRRPPNVIFSGPGNTLGEIGLLALSAEDAGRSADDVDREIEQALGERSRPVTAALPSGRRTASCSALDHVELARVGREDFLQLIQAFPSLRRRLVKLSLDRLAENDDPPPIMRQYIDQGLYQGQSLLVLDLTKCTRCDECTRACADQHGTHSHGLPITRLLREGLRFGNSLIATSCRSCKDAYCMIGCPVDSIHRGKHQQIVIEDHCIGCGLCAENCPYGNIWMMPNIRRTMETDDPDHPGQTQLVAQPKAASCDLCDSEGRLEHPVPRCVYACPHDAAHRMSGEELLKFSMSR